MLAGKELNSVRMEKVFCSKICLFVDLLPLISVFSI